MKYVLFLLVLSTQVVFARLDFDTKETGESYRAQKPSPFSFTFDIGLSKVFFLNKEFNEAYKKSFSSLVLMPVLRGAAFWRPSPSSFFALGAGLQFSYLSATGKTLKEDKKTEAKESQELVYVPYQAFLDMKFFFGRSLFTSDIWIGYEEAFVENRRSCGEACDSDGKVWISDSGRHWNSYLTLGASFGVSLKHFGDERSFSGRTTMGLRDIIFKVYYEHNIDLKAKTLLGNRLVTDVLRLAKGHVGVAFSFEL